MSFPELVDDPRGQHGQELPMGTCRIFVSCTILDLLDDLQLELRGEPLVDRAASADLQNYELHDHAPELLVSGLPGISDLLEDLLIELTEELVLEVEEMHRPPLDILELRDLPHGQLYHGACRIRQARPSC